MLHKFVTNSSNPCRPPSHVLVMHQLQLACLLLLQLSQLSFWKTANVHSRAHKVFVHRSRGNTTNHYRQSNKPLQAMCTDHDHSVSDFDDNDVMGS